MIRFDDSPDAAGSRASELVSGEVATVSAVLRNEKERDPRRKGEYEYRPFRTWKTMPWNKQQEMQLFLCDSIRRTIGELDRRDREAARRLSPALTGEKRWKF